MDDSIFILQTKKLREKEMYAILFIQQWRWMNGPSGWDCDVSNYEIISKLTQAQIQKKNLLNLKHKTNPYFTSNLDMDLEIAVANVS